jgi:DNA-binding MarR family transcriptional regulator
MKPIRLPCYCGSLRQASRALTQLYDRALRPSGVKITQFGILRLLAARPGLTTGQMASALVMDSTTLTRTLKIIESNQWIVPTPGSDRRERHWAITAAGEQRLQEAQPLWERAQQEFANLAGEIDLDALSRTIFQLAKKAGA